MAISPISIPWFEQEFGSNFAHCPSLTQLETLLIIRLCDSFWKGEKFESSAPHALIQWYNYCELFHTDLLKRTKLSEYEVITCYHLAACFSRLIIGLEQKFVWFSFFSEFSPFHSFFLFIFIPLLHLVRKHRTMHRWSFSKWF